MGTKVSIDAGRSARTNTQGEGPRLGRGVRPKDIHYGRFHQSVYMKYLSCLAANVVQKFVGWR
jgi:hypothetical protein